MLKVIKPHQSLETLTPPPPPTPRSCSALYSHGENPVWDVGEVGERCVAAFETHREEASRGNTFLKEAG